MRVCEWCGKELPKNKGRFCNRSCSAKWRIQTFGVPKASEEGNRRRAEAMKRNWENPKFRENNYKRMTENNPVYKEGVVEKANRTKFKKGNIKNNFKYGNGKISIYEQIALETLSEYGFVYNVAISTNKIRKKYPEKHIGYNYKPDFVNFEKKICIEIDGPNHLNPNIRELDAKKDWCLNKLGYEVIRITHEDIDKGKLGKLVKIWQS